MSFAMTFTTIIHVLLCVFMISVILLQPGKDAGMGSTLGGGGAASSAFGGRGAVTLLSKMTGVFAALFFLTSLGLSFVGLRSSVAADADVPAAAAPATSGTETVEQPVGATPEAPAAPAAPAEGAAPAAPNQDVPPPN